ncbi:MAG: mannose-1-phosphate guanylyltransferase/mannose-6-phosphate isomerase [Alphaproteobacteria bacterium]|nr:mannose-1-phosphate guanylyltransferase/mannose-6-phosphate isomerase [Alphaproteobacteria bacterium]
MTITPIILSGGAGTRLWPLSRSLYPKQFLKLDSNDTRSLLEATLQRLPQRDGYGAPVILANNDHRFLVSDSAKNMGVETAAIILEPVARNTAPAIAVAAVAAIQEDPEAVLVVMPSDHVIRDEDGFRAAVRTAAEVAAGGRLMLFGIAPDSPHTGYGYILKGAPVPGFEKAAFSVERFAEKPDAATAETYLADGGYFWNSGIFVLHAATFLAEMERLQPKMLASAKKALLAAKPDLEFLRLEESNFAACPALSIDYAIMEKTSKAAVLPVDLGWSDVGSWSSLSDLGTPDMQGNVAAGKAAEADQVVFEDTTNTYVYSTRSLVSTIGLDNMIIVETPDALLVSHKSRAQDVSKIVQRLKSGNGRQHEQHLRNHRPWGYFEQLAYGERFQVKLLHVKPGARLSMQMHHHRSEHWIVVKGTARVVIGDVEKLVRENESVYIFATEWHRLENPGKVPIELIEVQIGTYLGEDDIIRADDIYHRAPDETK